MLFSFRRIGRGSTAEKIWEEDGTVGGSYVAEIMMVNKNLLTRLLEVFKRRGMIL